MLTVIPIPAFSDNYIWCVVNEDSKEAIVIDPGSAKPVLEYLDSKKLRLSAILITHHHPDHIGGAIELKEKMSCEAYGYKHAKFKFLDHLFVEGDSFSLLGTSFIVKEVPGHTLDHIAFYSEFDSSHTAPYLFCGDTLFSGGCGRLFEGSAFQMQSSLDKLSQLPDNTEIYCAHEYTLANLAFAMSLMPQNKHLLEYLEKCKSSREHNVPTIPSTIETELNINPFLRTKDTELIQSISTLCPDIKISQTNIFAEIRKAKDHF